MRHGNQCACAYAPREEAGKPPFVKFVSPTRHLVLCIASEEWSPNTMPAGIVSLTRLGTTGWLSFYVYLTFEFEYLQRDALHTICSRRAFACMRVTLLILLGKVGQATGFGLAPCVCITAADGQISFTPVISPKKVQSPRLRYQRRLA